jgi:hypothetical protein
MGIFSCLFRCLSPTKAWLLPRSMSRKASLQARYKLRCYLMIKERITSKKDASTCACRGQELMLRSNDGKKSRIRRKCHRIFIVRSGVISGVGLYQQGEG